MKTSHPQHPPHQGTFKNPKTGAVFHRRGFSQAAVNRWKVNRAAPFSRATWKELHTRYLAWPGGKDTKWLVGFALRILPSGSCRCRENFVAYLRAHPVDWSNPFMWSVAAHNAVNARLGKPQLTEEVARSVWTPSS